MAHSSKPLPPPEILIVDDDINYCKLLRRVLSKNGFKVGYILGGKSLFKRLDKGKVELILLDLYMPDQDGFALLQQILQNPKFYRIPVVIITAADNDETLVKCYSLGARGFINKSHSTAATIAIADSLIYHERVYSRYIEFYEDVGDQLIKAFVFNDKQFHESIVEVMWLALQYWEHASGKGRLELAEATGWNVYTEDGGTPRTQTFDRYLSVKKLPKKPKVANVLRSAHYVMNHYPSYKPYFPQLKEKVSKLEHMVRHQL